MKIAYIRWEDACYEEAIESSDKVVPQLSILNECGFLLAENDVAVTLGMELDGDDGHTAPGRFRITIPKVAIQEMKVVDVASFLKMKGRKR